MNLNEAINILKVNNYIIEKLNFNYDEDRYSYTWRINSENKFDKMKNPKYGGNDNIPHRHFGTKKLKDYNFNASTGFKNFLYILNKYHPNIENDITQLDFIIDQPESCESLYRDLQKIDPELTENNIQDIIVNGITSDKKKLLKTCLYVRFKQLIELPKKIVKYKIPIFRVISIPGKFNIKKYLAKHPSTGTSWSYGGASDAWAHDDDAYMIAAEVENIKDIDIPSTVIMPFAWGGSDIFDYDTNEFEIRLNNSSHLKYTFMKKISNMTRKDWEEINKLPYTEDLLSI